MLPYTKPYLSLNDQLALLKSRGLQVADDAQAIECLHRNGYYRLSAYWYPFREIVATNPPRRSDNFLGDSRFEDAAALYIFDKQLKLLLLDAIERVEIAARVQVALCLGVRGAFAYTDPNLLHSNFSRPNRQGKIPYQMWSDKFESMVLRSRDEFVLHYEAKYGTRLPLPIWIAIELWDFGLLSHFFSGMQIKDKRSVAARFSIPDWQLLESWLRSLNYVRNVMAHHGRLWNLNLSDRPRLPALGVMPDFDELNLLPNANARLYSVCSILCYFSRVINPTSLWPQRLIELVSDFPAMPYANAQDMGFPINWKQQSLWKV